MPATKEATDFQFTLTKPINVSGGECKSFTVYAPSQLHLYKVAKIEGMMGRANATMVAQFAQMGNIQQLAETAKSEAEENSDPLQIIKMGGKDDDEFYPRFIQACADLLTTQGICKLDVEGCHLKQGYFEVMSSKDFTRLISEYIAFFIEQ